MENQPKETHEEKMARRAKLPFRIIHRDDYGRTPPPVVVPPRPKPRATTENQAP